MAKTTVQTRGPGGTTELLAEQFAAGVGLLQLVATAIPTVVGKQVLDLTDGVVKQLDVGVSGEGDGASHALATVTGGTVRFWEDGTNPTASEGLLLADGQSVEFTNLADVRLIEASEAPVMSISYRRYDA